MIKNAIKITTYIRGLRRQPLGCRLFCDKKPTEQSEQEIWTDKQKQMIDGYKINSLWNRSLGLDPNQNLQKQLIRSFKKYESERKDLREAILFQDLLKNELIIDIYDTKAKLFYWNIGKFIFVCTVTLLGLYFAKLEVEANPKLKVFIQQSKEGKIFKNFLVYSSYLVLAVAVFRHINFLLTYVQRIRYDTQKEEFLFIYRKIYGTKATQKVSRYKLMYTQNPTLRSAGTNYFHIDSKRQYSIHMKEAWIKKDLFSHLIAQRIKV